MEYNIVVDAREPAQMVDQINAQAQMSGWLSCSSTNNETGDFVLTRNVGGKTFILAVFERKTWSDLAASIKDGRCESQVPRLDDLRLKNIKVYFVIEGLMPPCDGVTVGMKNVCIYGMLDSLSSREFCMVHTRDEGHTASRIINICKHITEHQKKLFKTCTELYVHKLTQHPPELPDDFKNDLQALATKYGSGEYVDQVVVDKSHTPLGICENMWRSLAPEKVTISLMKEFTIKEVYNNTSLINDLRYDGGRKIPKKTIDKIKSLIVTDEGVVGLIKCVKGAGSQAQTIVDVLTSRHVMGLTEPTVVEHNGRKINRNILPAFIEAINFKLEPL